MVFKKFNRAGTQSVDWAIFSGQDKMKMASGNI